MPPDHTVSDLFQVAFRARANGADVLDYAQFMVVALYDPGVGYYRQPRQRIGYEPGTDFFTASTSGAVFGELVAAACESLLGTDAAREHTFVELGAEPGGGVLAGVAHPFARACVVRVDEPITLAGRCIVFSNELFDAQPFHRYVFRQDRWWELGVRLVDRELTEIALDRPAPAGLPGRAPEGYTIDSPVAAAELADRIAAQPWSGLFLAFDYGKSWHELATACPAGTARAYFQHRQTNDLLAHAGAQDLTCHICWDWIEAALVRHGFASPLLDAQETFLVRRATRGIARIAEADAAGFSRRKQTLQQLLQPGQLGRKFQVLHALRALPVPTPTEDDTPAA